MPSILFITHTLSMGGAEKVLAVLLHGIANSYTIDVIERTEDTSYIYQLPNVNKLPSMSYTSRAAAKYRTNKYWQKIWLILLKVLIIIVPAVIYRKYIKKQYDYEISFNYLFTSFLVARSRNKKSKKIMWIHSSIEDFDYRQYHGIKRIVYFICNKCQRKAFVKADKIIAISNKTKNSIETLYHENVGKIVLLPN